MHKDTVVNPNFLLFCIPEGTADTHKKPRGPPPPKLSTGYT